MIDIKEVLRRWSARQSLHRIARETGVDRKTVRRYVHAANSCSLPQRTRFTRSRSGCSRALCPIRAPSGKRSPRTASASGIAHQEAAVAADQGAHAPGARARSRGQLRHAPSLRHAEARVAPETTDGPSRRSAPGQEAQVDFGKMGPMLRPRSGARALALGGSDPAFTRDFDRGMRDRSNCKAKTPRLV
jgi:hypothetical protein